ncbi:MAG TPA: hypothetical protein VNW29_04655 [Candidatus Sulfotelmatobacter sp.]|jgi:hypothetical protein|nr:hypothetical protein [Candidatus Sulfotelmatobacter sp.]
MNETSNLVKADKIIRWGMTLSFVLLLLQAGVLALFYLKLPPIVPLFNQMPWGDTRLGATYEMLLPLVITAVFFIFNYILLTKLYIAMPLVSRIIGITTLLAALLSFIFVVRTLQLII